MCEFRIGQKVVCVDASTSPGREWDNGDPAPVEGDIYTVTGIIDSADHKRGPFALIIREMPRGAWARSHGYFGYNSSRFRPTSDIVESHLGDAIEQLNKAVTSLRIAADRIAEAS